jgi:hypothetical protein
MSLMAGKKIRPMKRILVKMLDVKQDYHNPMGLNLISHKKHYDYQFRRGIIVAMDPRIQWHLPEVLLGDVVIFSGASGFTLDGDIMDEDDKYDAPLKGESYRWLHWKEIDAVDEEATLKHLSPEMEPRETENLAPLAKSPEISMGEQNAR